MSHYLSLSPSPLSRPPQAPSFLPACHYAMMSRPSVHIDRKFNVSFRWEESNGRTLKLNGIALARRRPLTLPTSTTHPPPDNHPAPPHFLRRDAKESNYRFKWWLMILPTKPHLHCHVIFLPRMSTSSSSSSASSCCGWPQVCRRRESER